MVQLDRERSMTKQRICDSCGVDIVYNCPVCSIRLDFSEARQDRGIFTEHYECHACRQERGIYVLVTLAVPSRTS